MFILSSSLLNRPCSKNVINLSFIICGSWIVFVWLGLQERVLRCYELIQEMGLISSRAFKSVSGSVSSVPQSPIGVLDAAACLSYKSDEITVRPCTNSHTSPEPIPKRRKLDRPSEMDLKSWSCCKDGVFSFHISQFSWLNGSFGVVKKQPRERERNK